MSDQAIAGRAANLRAVWAPSAVSRQIADWEEGMQSVVDDPGHLGYDKNRYAVTSWEKVRVRGVRAVAYFGGHEIYHDGDGRWAPDQALRNRVDLWRPSSNSEQWYLLKV